VSKSAPDPQVTLAVSQIDALVVSSVPWEYADSRTDLGSLYNIAKRKVWDAERDLKWQAYSRDLLSPVNENENPLNGFASFENLNAVEKRGIAWWQHRLDLSEILHGEQGALIIASQLVASLTSVEGKLFASSQVYDEARHVEFFSRYLREVAGGICPPSDALKTLVQRSISDSRWDMKLLACQILIESLAMARFQEIRRATTIPLLRKAIDYILKDEARHTSFGITLLRDHIGTLKSEDREYRSDLVINSLLSLTNALNAEVRIANALQWDTAALRRHLRLHRLRNPEVNRTRFRILMRNLESIGLLTTKALERIHGIDAHI